MSSSPDQFEQVQDMIDKFGMAPDELTEEVVEYRMGLIDEEYEETMKAHSNGDAEGVIDGHVDLIVILMGNLSIFGVDGLKAFREVISANMKKEPGKRCSSDPDGVSISKPEGWVEPNHSDNHGDLDEFYG